MTIVLILIVVLIILIGLWFILAFNSLVRLRNEVAQGLSSIDVQLKRRADLIPNLVETVKGYATHETAAFESVSAARAKALGATTLDEKAAADGEMQQAVGKLFAIAEAYPELRAVEAFTQLHTELSDTEDN
ncbi:MAG: LemA family protein, partial [Gaiellales bacterium]